MFKSTLCGLTVAGVVAVAGLTVSAPSAEAGVKVFITPQFGAYGHTYDHNYYGDYSRRCYWERRRVRYRKCWRNAYGKRKCRWKRRWRRVKVC